MAERSKTSSRGLIVGLSVAVVLGLLLFVVRPAFREKVEVRTASVAHAPLISVVSTNGKVEPLKDFQAHAAAAGVVQKVYVAVNDHVQRGQLLLKMDESDARSKLASAQASLDAAVRDLKNMQGGGTQDELLSQGNQLTTAHEQQQTAAADLAKIQALQARGSASANEVASAKRRLADAQSRVSQLQTRRKGRYSGGDIAAQRSAVAQARAAVLAAQSAFGSVEVRAPFAGTVYSARAANYDFEQFGDALINIADLDNIQVRAYFDEPEIGKLNVGQPVTIMWDAKPYSTWHGHIKQVPTTIVTYGTTRNVGECLITVDDANGELLPNTNVTVKVTVSQLANVLSLPREALRTEGLHNFVYRIVDGRLHKTAVQVGASNLTRFQILGGLSDGDIVALGSPSNTELKDGLEVKALP
ncbi:MAG: efflux RND transporter periplasmic adaptor subunit [Acidobacteriaceae bacterium]